MKVNRDDIKWFLDNIKRRANGKELANEELANELAFYIEANPRCIDVNGKCKSGRYSYYTVGYGVFSLLSERYRMGRIEIYDRENNSGYAIDEGSYCMPYDAASQFEDFIESLETDFPINIEIGSIEECRNAVSDDLGIHVDKLNDTETKRDFYKKKNDEYAREKGYRDFDDMLNNNFPGGLKQKTN